MLTEQHDYWLNPDGTVSRTTIWTNEDGDTVATVASPEVQAGAVATTETAWLAQQADDIATNQAYKDQQVIDQAAYLEARRLLMVSAAAKLLCLGLTPQELAALLSIDLADVPTLPDCGGLVPGPVAEHNHGHNSPDTGPDHPLRST